MELNLQITLPDDATQEDVVIALRGAAANAVVHLLHDSLPEVDEQVHLDKNVVFFRSE